MTSLQTSKFLTAESRLKEQSLWGSSYTSTCGDQLFIKDVYLLPGQSLTIQPSAWPQNIIMPVVGKVMLEGGELHPGQLYLAEANSVMVLKNPFQAETINLLYIAINEIPVVDVAVNSLDTIAIEAKNCLNSGGSFARHISVGVYDGRAGQQLKKSNPVFAYVINGSFEMEGRLVEYRDALFLPDGGEIEIEALSEAAIILLIDLFTQNEILWKEEIF